LQTRQGSGQLNVEGIVLEELVDVGARLVLKPRKESFYQAEELPGQVVLVEVQVGDEPVPRRLRPFVRINGGDA
jgi:hypothetical protein